jgi:hypothetical protein
MKKYLLIKNNSVILTSSGPTDPQWQAETGMIEVYDEGNVGDAFVSGTVYPRPSTQHTFDVDNRQWVLPGTPAEHLQSAKQSAKNRIDIKAGDTRAKYITSVPGQAETYTAKYEDAKQFAAAGYPLDTTNYPWVKADSEAYGITPKQAADNIIMLRNAWTNIGTTVEKIRLAGKTQVELATTVEQINAAADAAVSQLELL